MQASAYASSSSYDNPRPIYRNKHGRDSEDEDALLEQQQGPTSSVNTVAGGLQGRGRVHFTPAQAERPEGPQFPTAVKRRKTSHLDFEPVFQGLSLDTDANNGYLHTAQPDQSLDIPAEEDVGTAVQDRGRRTGRRETTPFPGAETFVSSVLDEPEHRRRSTSRNRARVRTSSREATMSRYDPSRPHVVFVESLSDSDDDNSIDPESSRSTTIPSTRNNSPSSDGDEVIPPSAASRPIHLNRRLRDYLRRQQRGESGPVPEGILASSPNVHGNGVDERGLVLYRPLSFGIVEEPGEELLDDGEEEAEDVRIQELPPDSGSGDMLADGDTEMDGSMDID